MRSLAITLTCLFMLAGASHAQQTLDERIKRAQEAQAVKDAEAKAKADLALRAASGPAMNTPTVRITADPSVVGRIGPTGAPTQQISERIELVQIKGFLDEPNSLEALVFVNGQRYAVTQQQRQLADGWELATINPEAVEIVKGNTRRTLRFVQFFAPTAQTPTRQP